MTSIAIAITSPAAWMTPERCFDMAQVTFRGNRATFGGGLFANGGFQTFYNNMYFYNNSASIGGGAYLHQPGQDVLGPVYFGGLVGKVTEFK